MLALVWSIQCFRPYLLGRQFHVRTDHSSLQWLYNIREPEGQVARWLERLAEFQFKVTHRPGKQHCNADSLSRIDLSCHFAEIKESNWFPQVTQKDMLIAQENDTDVNTVLGWIRTNTIPASLLNMPVQIS